MSEREKEIERKEERKKRERKLMKERERQNALLPNDRIDITSRGEILKFTIMIANLEKWHSFAKFFR